MFREILRQKRPALFKLGHSHFHHDNAPVFNSILVTDYIYIYRVEFSGEEVIVLPLAFMASLFVDELRSRQPFERINVNNSYCDS